MSEDNNSHSNGDEINRPSKRFRSKSIDKQKSSTCSKVSSENGDCITKSTSHSANLGEIISSSILQNVDGLAKSYQSNTEPYPHGFLENIFVDGFLGKLGFVLISLLFFLIS